LYSDKKSLISQRLLSDVSLTKVLAHHDQQAVKNIGDQYTDYQFALNISIPTSRLLQETQDADIKHQEVKVHSLQE
jgi:hypothetical protein